MLRATAVMSPHRREGGAGSRCTYSVALCNPPTTQNHPKYSTPSPRCTLPTVPFPSLYPIHFPTLYRAASLPLREGRAGTALHYKINKPPTTHSNQFQLFHDSSRQQYRYVHHSLFYRTSGIFRRIYIIQQL